LLKKSFYTQCDAEPAAGGCESMSEAVLDFRMSGKARGQDDASAVPREEHTQQNDHLYELSFLVEENCYFFNPTRFFH